MGLLVDALTCDECSHSLPGHFGVCSLRKPSTWPLRAKKSPKAPKPFPCCGGLMACAQDCPERCKECGAASYEKHSCDRAEPFVASPMEGA